MNRLGPDNLSTLQMKGHVLHRARAHLKVPGCSLVCFRGQTIFYFEEMQIKVWFSSFWDAFHEGIEPEVTVGKIYHILRARWRVNKHGDPIYNFFLIVFFNFQVINVDYAKFPKNVW